MCNNLISGWFKDVNFAYGTMALVQFDKPPENLALYKGQVGLYQKMKVNCVRV